MKTSKLSAFALGTAISLSITIGLGTLFNAIYLWASDWLRNDNGLTFWQTAAVMGLLAGVISFVRAWPELKKITDEFCKKE